MELNRWVYVDKVGMIYQVPEPMTKTKADEIILEVVEDVDYFKTLTSHKNMEECSKYYLNK